MSPAARNPAVDSVAGALHEGMATALANTNQTLQWCAEAERRLVRVEVVS